MTQKRLPPLLVPAALVMIAITPAPASAHHSFAMFDHDKSATLNGTVEKYQWTNPHGYIVLQVPDGSAFKAYLLECTSINMMSRKGWTSRTLKPGDKVQAVIAPLRNGQPGGLAIEVVLPTGKMMETGVPNPASFKRTPG
jgi:hypothetical protein